MADIRNPAIAALGIAALVLAGLLLHQRTQTAQARQALAEYQLAGERATELQRESNRGRAATVEERVVVQTVYRDRFITKTVKEIERVTQPMAACPVPADAVRLLNDAARCAREDRPAACGADDAVPDAG
ncbi:hypothetical protein [Pseudorhodoferax soli]|uniref:Uncharacterized protein n=1 Tax=Pseudorhodoferax soli TaxID=545864 RepID=A0A368Y6G2_9BURK|nr:hypothetical protein [Pseudorhodoferax soli]RCW73794.1 hypothetical protein DES41_102108 [Pseudorhodoferax soli]